MNFQTDVDNGSQVKGTIILIPAYYNKKHPTTIPAQISSRAYRPTIQILGRVSYSGVMGGFSLVATS
jgi:hypothetical protein